GAVGWTASIVRHWHPFHAAFAGMPHTSASRSQPDIIRVARIHRDNGCTTARVDTRVALGLTVCIVSRADWEPVNALNDRLAPHSRSPENQQEENDLVNELANPMATYICKVHLFFPHASK